MSDEAPEAEPQSWGSFFEGVGKKLTDLISRKKAERDAGTLTPEGRLRLFQEDVARAYRVKVLLDSTVWKEDIEPFLRSAASLKPWVPGGPLKLEEVSTIHLFNSGKVFVLKAVLDKMGEWVRLGEHASRELTADAQRRAKIKAATAR